MSPRSVTRRRRSAVRKAAWAASDARSGARTRSTSEAISVVAIRSSGAGTSPPRARSRSRPTASEPTRSSTVSTPGASLISTRSSAVERAATASTALERSISTSDASSARAAARTTSGNPRPASTASVIAPSAPRSGTAASERAGEVTSDRLEPVREVPEETGPDARAGQDERGQHVEAEHGGHEPVAHAPVGLPGGHDDKGQPGDQRDRGGHSGDQVGLLVVGHGSPAL